jgi:prepilin-type N-terminal cleavage/methylation domain-containing protein
MLNHLQKIKKNQKGFTIIEVMIVLAIAGLIILVVLLAVPALQRNGRNTAIKNDAATIGGGIAEFRSNNDGTGPSAVGGTGTIAISGPAPTVATNSKVQGSTVVNSAGSTTPLLGTISVTIGKNCGGTPNARAYAVWYATENSSALPQYKCVDA